MKVFPIKRTGSFFILIMISAWLHAQESKTCGTTLSPESEKLITEGLIPANKLRTSATEPYKLAVTAHIIRREDGTGGLSEAQLRTALETVNGFYKTAGLEFFIFGDIDYVNSDKFFDFDAGDENTLANSRDIPNTINIYFANSIVSSGSALCGYAYFPGNPDRILMDNSCTTNGTTLSHEIGHYLTLYHTHGKTNNGTTDELVDGSNCTTAGDEICDTPADPNLTGKVNSSCQYTSSQRDANGDLYQPNTENIMSYAPQNCRRLFTSGQFDRALSGYLSFRNYLIQKPYMANFDAEQSVICVGDQVNFNNLSLGDYESLEWSFVNGVPNVSTVEAPSVSYSSAGSYDVQLTIHGLDGGTDTRIVENAVKVLEYGTVELNGLAIDFETTTIDDFELHSPSNTYSFSIESVGQASDKSLSFQFYSNTDNVNDDIILLDPIQNPETMDYIISFDYAFTYFSDGSSERADEIKILTKGCNQWESVWTANGKTDATSAPKASSFSPNAQEWIHVEKYVPVEETSEFVQLAIQANSNNGNNFYIDNLAVDYATGIVVRDVKVTNERCAGEANGEIEVKASFNGNAISYSIDGENFQTNGIFPDLPGGDYQVAIKSGEEIKTVDVKIPITSQKPAKPLIVYSENELRLLSGAFSIEWYFNDELIDASGTTKIPFAGNGDYYVIVRNETGCENRSDIFTILSAPIKTERFIIYPNPTGSFLNVEVEEKTSFQIMDLTGKILINRPEIIGKVAIDVTILNNGVYLIRGISEKTSQSRVFIKK